MASKGWKRGYGECEKSGKEYTNRKKTQYCEFGFELGGSFVGNPPQPKCPASVEILSSPEGSMRSIKVTPNDDRNFAFVSGTEPICHTNKCLQLQRTLVASDKLQEFSCHHIKADYYF